MSFSSHSYTICVSFVCQSYVLVCRSYVTRMSLACTHMSPVCHSYVLVCHLYVTRMYSYVTRMSFVCTCMSPICHSYVLICHPYITHMYSYVIRMSLVCGLTMKRKEIFRKLDNGVLKYLVVRNILNKFTVIVQMLIQDEKHQLVIFRNIFLCTENTLKKRKRFSVSYDLMKK